MIMRFVISVMVVGLSGVISVGVQAAGKAGSATYAGQHNRPIKSLSADDIAALEAGRGWGFAKPAELNGYPGPLHVLELAKELKLTDEQLRQVQAAFDEMKAAAQRAGRSYLATERALDAAFAKGTATPNMIADLTLAAAKARAEVRRVHLQAHLQTTPLLIKAQRHRYATLRGYTGAGHRDGSSVHQHRKGSHSGH